jgi:peptide/nickel transport system substrate-binding protein
MDKAKQLMDQAGYVDTNGDGIREFPGTKEPLTFNLLVLSNDTNSSGAGQYVKEWMTELGWKVNLKVLTPGKITSLWGTGDYDAYIWYWTGDPDPNFMLSVFTTDQCRVWSDTCWSNAQYDALYKQQQAQTDLATRQSTVDQMQTMYYQQVPEVMLFYTLDLQAVRSDKWTGFQRSPQPGGGYIYGWGPFTYLNVQPKSGAAAASTSSGESGGSKAFVWVGAAVLLFAIALVILRRRRRRVEDES